jgi:hypothetical protein
MVFILLPTLVLLLLPTGMPQQGIFGLSWIAGLLLTAAPLTQLTIFILLLFPLVVIQQVRISSKKSTTLSSSLSASAPSLSRRILFVFGCLLIFASGWMLPLPKLFALFALPTPSHWAGAGFLLALSLFARYRNFTLGKIIAAFGVSLLLLIGLV